MLLLCSCSSNSNTKPDNYSLPEYRLTDFREANEQCAAYFIAGDIRTDVEQSLESYSSIIDTAFEKPITDNVWVAALPGDRRVWVQLENEVMGVFRFLWKDQVYEQRHVLRQPEQGSTALEPSFFISVTSTTESTVSPGDWEPYVAPKEYGSIHRYRTLADDEDIYNESVDYHCKSPLGSYFYSSHYLTWEQPLRRPRYPNQIITGYTLGKRSLYLILNCEGAKCGVHIVEDDEVEPSEAATDHSERFLGGPFAPALNIDNALIPGAQRFFSLPFSSSVSNFDGYSQ